MTTFIVAGRKFTVQLHAVTFARHEAQRTDQSVDVKAEVTNPFGKTSRVWVATLHPPGLKRTLLADESDDEVRTQTS
jgi:hypothetical protein